MIFYFTGTGNSLYAARQLGDDPVSIAQELNREDRHYEAESIGIVCPLYEFDLPRPVRKFILESTFECDYFFVVATFGMHHGGMAERVAAQLEEAGRRVDYYNTIMMVDNAITVFDMVEQLRIDPEKKVDEHLAAIRADIEARKRYIQPAAKEEVDFYQGYMEHPFNLRGTNDDPLYRLTDACVGCGTCARVCPMGCIRMEDGRPVYDYTDCASCFACIHACPAKALRFVNFDEPNPDARYRNPHVSIADLAKAAKRG